jgi:hypothetical protein
MVEIDACFLGLILHPKARPPIDPATKKPIPKLAERIDKLQDDWDVSRERIIIPTPALAEFLVLAASDGPAYLNELNTRGNFYIKPFDQKAAIELAGMEILARSKGSKRTPASQSEPWQKVKIDRQIVAIARTNSAQTIYSDDNGIRSFAEDVGIKVVSSWQLDLPESKTPLLDQIEEPKADPAPTTTRRIDFED